MSISTYAQYRVRLASPAYQLLKTISQTEDPTFQYSKYVADLIVKDAKKKVNAPGSFQEKKRLLESIYDVELYLGNIG